MERIEELNKEYEKYSKAVVNLLDQSLNEGEIFMFFKNKDNSYGMILSEERESLMGVNYVTQSSRILKAIKEIREDTGLWFTHKTTDPLLSKSTEDAAKKD